MASMPSRMVSASRTTPLTSRLAAGRRTPFGRYLMASITRAIPIGTLTKKMPRQLQSWAMSPPNTGPDDAADRKNAGEHGERLVPVPTEVVGDDARRRRHEGPASDGLDQPEGHQHVDARRQATGERRGGEDHRRQYVDLLAAELVGDPAGQRHGHDLPELVDGHRPGRPVDGGVEGLADRVEGGGDDGAVHRGHEQAQRDDGEDQTAPGEGLAGVDSRRGSSAPSGPGPDRGRLWPGHPRDGRLAVDGCWRRCWRQSRERTCLWLAS